MPSQDTVVDTDTKSREPEARYGWDWSATTHDGAGIATTPLPVLASATVKDMAAALIESIGGDLYLPGKGLQGWAESVQVYDDEGYRLGSVYFGGDRSDVHVVSTSEAADAVRPRIVGLYRAKTSRVDTRVDTLLSFEDLRDLCLDVAGPRTKVTYMESTVGGDSTGRTLYVGSPASDVRVRVYEKWLESPGQWVDGTNRVEVQLRPPSRGKLEVSYWEAGDTFCATKLTRRLAEALGRHVHKPGSLQKSKGTPDLEATLAAMGTQYGKAVRTWLNVSKGDIGRVLDHLNV